MSEKSKNSVGSDTAGSTSPVIEQDFPAVAVATSSEAQAVRAALDTLDITAEVIITTHADSLGERPILVVGTLVDAFSTEDLSLPSRDFLPGTFTHDELALRLRVLTDRSNKASLQLAESDDLAIIVRSIADALRVAIMFYDTNNLPKMRNKMVDEVLTLTGRDPETGKSAHVYAPDRRTPVKRDKDIVTETLQGDARGIIYWVGDPDHDRQRAVITEALRIKRPDGTPLGAATLSYDITDLANAIEVRDDYLTSISHELRTPLTAIVGYLDLIAENYDIEELGFQREFEIIQRDLDQVTSLVNELSIAGGREQNLRIEPVNLGDLVSQSVGAVQPSADAIDQNVHLELPPSSLVALVDATRIRQVLDNLLSNAVKYTPPKGRIDVSLSRNGDDAVILVTNTGAGLTVSDQDQIFDRFFRTQEARDAGSRGVGIGLTIAKTLIEAHGGSIAVDSKRDEYTTFTVTLPLRREGVPLSDLPEEP
ncbi:MAG: HAMP domain-containing histidine kinase [Microbacteriaceae bacterium]|nr:HAMP domain-containing histidine kinase [Microbacteriaceae bacterium]